MRGVGGGGKGRGGGGQRGRGGGGEGGEGGGAAVGGEEGAEGAAAVRGVQQEGLRRERGGGRGSGQNREGSEKLGSGHSFWLDTRWPDAYGSVEFYGTHADEHLGAHDVAAVLEFFHGPSLGGLASVVLFLRGDRGGGQRLDVVALVVQRAHEEAAQFEGGKKTNVRRKRWLTTRDRPGPAKHTWPIVKIRG